MMKSFSIFFLILCLFGCDHPESAEFNRENESTKIRDFLNSEKVVESIRDTKIKANSTKFKVIGIKDGDTFDLLIEDNTTQTIRFAHIDCPEKNQPFGKLAKQFVSDKCFGKYVSLIHNNKYDRDHRLIAEVILEDGTNLNKLLLENGLAWHYKKYSKDEFYSKLENKARQNQIGLWANPNSIEPAKWRKRKSK